MEFAIIFLGCCVVMAGWTIACPGEIKDRSPFSMMVAAFMVATGFYIARLTGDAAADLVKLIVSLL